MLLKYYGFSVDKETMAYQYLPTVSADLYYGSDGLLYGPDMESNFVGNPGGTGYVCGTTAIVTAANRFLNQFGSNVYATAMNNVSLQTVYDFLGNPGGTGYVCGTTAIVTAANRFLNQFGSNVYATAMNNVSLQTVYDFLGHETPVLVWVTIGMAPRSEIHGWYTEEGDFMEWAENDHGAVLIGYNDTVLVWVTIGMAPRSEIHGWYTEEGDFMEWAENDHGAVLIGYNDTSVIIADPILGEYSCDKESFETVFSSRGNKCVVLQKIFKFETFEQIFLSNKYQSVEENGNKES